MEIGDQQQCDDIKYEKHFHRAPRFSGNVCGVRILTHPNHAGSVQFPVTLEKVARQKNHDDRLYDGIEIICNSQDLF